MCASRRVYPPGVLLPPRLICWVDAYVVNLDNEVGHLRRLVGHGDYDKWLEKTS